MEDQKENFKIISISDAIGLKRPSSQLLNTKVGFIALLDACGISHLNIDKVKLFVNALLNQEYYIDIIFNGNTIRELLAGRDVDSSFEFFLFQDSIIISLETFNRDKALQGLPIFVQMLSAFVLHSMSYQIFFRGAISYGEYVKSPIGYFGNAINEAARLYDLPRYFGIIASDSVAELNRDPIYQNERSWITYDPIKCKDSYKQTTIQSHNIVNWHFFLPSLSPEPELEIPENASNLQVIKKIIEKKIIESDHPIELYSNTLEFIEDSFKKYPTFDRKRYLINSVFSSGELTDSQKTRFLQLIQWIDDFFFNNQMVLAKINDSPGWIEILNVTSVTYFYNHTYILTEWNNKLQNYLFLDNSCIFKTDNSQNIIYFERGRQYMNIFCNKIQYDNIFDFVYPVSFQVQDGKERITLYENTKILRISVDDIVFLMDHYINQKDDFFAVIKRIMDQGVCVFPYQQLLFWSDKL